MRNDQTQASVTNIGVPSVVPAVVKIGQQDQILAQKLDHHMAAQIANVTNKMVRLAVLLGDWKAAREILGHDMTVTEAIAAQTLDLHPVDLVVVEMIMQGHHNAVLTDDQEISDHRAISPA